MPTGGIISGAGAEMLKKFGASTIVGLGLNEHVPLGLLGLLDGVIPLVIDIPELSNTLVPLTMYINPSSLKIERSPTTSTVQTFSHDVIYHWGENPAKLSCHGFAGLFINPFTGVVDALRALTPAYHFFNMLFEIYRNNGIVTDKEGKPMHWRPLTITWEDRIFYGFFESFSYSDKAEQPYTLEYDFNFTSLHEVYV